MCLPAILPAVLMAGASIYSGIKSANAQKSAQASAERQAADAAQRSEQQQNRMMQKQPGLAAIMSANKKMTSKGPSSTFLTGSRGVTDMAGSLGGRPSLLGS
jgi:hypothetical protein